MKDIKTQLQSWLRASSLVLASMLSACAASGGGTPAAMSEPVAVNTSVAVQGAPPSAALPAEAQLQYDQALTSLKAGQNDIAKQQLQKLAASYPSFTGATINLGLLELKAARYEAASGLFKHAVECDKNSVVANNYLGVSYRYLGRFKDAEAAYQSAIAADDTYAAAHLNLGVLYDLYLQQPELALSEYERYQQLLGTPDAKVASWIKELNSRLKADRKVMAGGGAPQ